MAPEKVRKVLRIYKEKLERFGTQKRPFPHDLKLDSSKAALEHAYNMIDQMEEFIKQDRMDKVYRWLGFLQGILWMERVYTLEELKNHNKKDS